MGASTERIGLRELRQYASRYIEYAEEGGTVEVTRRGRPVVRMTAIETPHDPVARLEADGVLLPKEDPGDLLELLPVRRTSGSPAPSDELQRMRAEERW